MAVHQPSGEGSGAGASASASGIGEGIRIRLLHLGNSIQYYNDCPTLLKELLLHSPREDVKIGSVTQRVCLRGGSNYTSLQQKGTHWFRRMLGGDYGCNTLQELFATDTDNEEEEWDYTFVIMNDHTQSPARSSTREESIQILQSTYKEYIETLPGKTPAIPILIETAAYSKDNAYGSKDIGNFEQFTQAVQEGCQMYQTKLQQSLGAADSSSVVYVCPWGTAHQQIRNQTENISSTDDNQSLLFHWKKLYSFDYKHPSPHGTLLQAYMLYIMIQQHIQNQSQNQKEGGEPPKQLESISPNYKAEWLDEWHRMAVPTQEEAKQLLQIAQQTLLQQQQQQQQQQPKQEVEEKE